MKKQQTVKTKTVESSNRMLSNPFSTGGGGVLFETNVQAAFALLMLTDGYIPATAPWPVFEIRLQGKRHGFNTDDLIVYTKNTKSQKTQKLVAQVKHKLQFTARDSTFKAVIADAWSDYQNEKVFARNEDAIAIITGPLSATDVDGARDLLEWARETKSATEFFDNVGRSKFSSINKQNKLKAFQAQLKSANKNVEPDNEQTHDFLRHFHILNYDLDIRSGVVLSLLHSLIDRYSLENAKSIWSQLVNEVQYANTRGSRLHKEYFSKELREKLTQNADVTSKSNIISLASTEYTINWNKHPAAAALMKANLVGGWDEDFEKDVTLLKQILTDEYEIFSEKLSNILQEDNPPLNYKTGKWKIKNRRDVWLELASRIHILDLKKFQKMATEVLSAYDTVPIDETGEEKFNFNSDKLGNSRLMKVGIAETLALLSAFPEAVDKCDQAYVGTISFKVLTDSLKETDWKSWSFLNEVLPLLAEASPDVFLEKLEKSLANPIKTFSHLFKNEGKGLFGKNLLTGTLWSLELLAWLPNYFHSACELLVKLAEIDPGGIYSNRPINSLRTIFMLWKPQTDVSLEIRLKKLEHISLTSPEIFWKIIEVLLNSGDQQSTGTYKPKFRAVSAELVITPQIFYESEDSLFEIALKSANTLPELIELISISGLKESFVLSLLKKFLTHAKSNLSPNETKKLWHSLALLERRFPHEDAPELFTLLEELEKKYLPDLPRHRYSIIFSYRDPEYMRDRSPADAREQHRRERRHEAVKEILEFGGLTEIFKFADEVEDPFAVGAHLADILNSKDELEILNAEFKSYPSFIEGYLRIRLRNEDHEWLNQLPMSQYLEAKQITIINALPFIKIVWDASRKWFKNHSKFYWRNISPRPFECDSLDYAVTQLIKAEQPAAAISCLVTQLHRNQQISISQAISALNMLQSTGENQFDVYNCIDLIKAIQKDNKISIESKAKIEWKYIELADSDEGFQPINLEFLLGSDSGFFMQVITTLYHSEHVAKEKRPKPTDEVENLARLSWKLLWNWSKPPGTTIDGAFDCKLLTNWLKEVRTKAKKSGHLGVAQTHIGHVLFYAQPDPDGLWINRCVAKVLDDFDSEEIRHGYEMEVTNSRGAHWVDPTAAPELELSKQYESKAEVMDENNFHRFALTLRKIAKDFEREATRILSKNFPPD